MPTTILDLPLEIRQLIYAAVLDSELPPPSCPSENVHSGKGWPADRNFTYVGDDRNMYPLSPFTAAGSGLLLTNRQHRAETLDAIAAFKAHRQLRYKLDCMIGEEARLYHTWLSVPLLSSRIDIVEIDVRILNRLDRFGLPPNPFHVFWSLDAMLRRFLEGGPDFRTPPNAGRVIEVGTIVLNFMSPAESADGSTRPDRVVDGPTRSLLRVFNELSAKPEFKMPRTIPQPPIIGEPIIRDSSIIICERVKRMSLRLDGKSRKEWEWDLQVITPKIFVHMAV
ncbi:MAG: hypothetical protein M1816_002100 [Peltula sp. TS41687]|nr:MAG: hypothetical protein M1816_002100 [Peltula sp. TS41687]